MPIRITGMNSGLDTESIISELVKAKTTKKDSLVKAQTKLQWKQDAWKELNSKVYALYSKTLSNMRLESDYMKKTTKVSNASAATVITGANAVNGVQSLKINQMAKTGYLTGGQLKKNGVKADYTSATKLTDMGVEKGSEIQLKVGAETTKITVDENMTVRDFVSKLSSAGLNASFDEKNQRFFISAKKAGASADFSITATGSGQEAIKALGLETSLVEDTATRSEYMKYCVQNIDSKGKVSYIAKDVSALTDLIDEEVQNRLTAYISNQKDLTDVKEQIQKIEDKYTGTLESKDVLEEEIAAKEKELGIQAGEESDNEGLCALREKLENKNKLDSLKAKETELTEAIAADEAKGYFETDNNGSYQLKGDTLKNDISAEKWKFAQDAAAALNEEQVSTGATRIAGQDAVITLNGAVFTSETNTFEINGLTITANAETQEEITLSTADDTDGIYDMIKGFLKEYNELINEMDKLYNADSSKGYEPLTDEEKEAMSEKEVEKWEEKIKNSILRRDSTLSTVASAMKQVMLQGVQMKDGSQLYLSEFGIGTLGYFTSKDNEKNAYHIDGDPDDSATMTNADKLKTAIANDSEKVIEFFTTLSKNLYAKLGDLMKKTEYSSSFTLYDDVAMKDEYNDYTTKIKNQEEKITDFEDRYYKKFSAMETALAKLSSKESAISGLLGM